MMLLYSNIRVQPWLGVAFPSQAKQKGKGGGKEAIWNVSNSAGVWSAEVLSHLWNEEGKLPDTKSRETVVYKRQRVQPSVVSAWCSAGVFNTLWSGTDLNNFRERCQIELLPNWPSFPGEETSPALRPPASALSDFVEFSRLWGFEQLNVSRSLEIFIWKYLK